MSEVHIRRGQVRRVPDPGERRSLAVDRGPVPSAVSRLQLRDCLRASGDWETVRAAIAADEDASEAWELATSIERNHPLTEQIGMALGADADALDLIFREAAKR